MIPPIRKHLRQKTKAILKQLQSTRLPGRLFLSDGVRKKPFQPGYAHGRLIFSYFCPVVSTVEDEFYICFHHIDNPGFA